MSEMHVQHVRTAPNAAGNGVQVAQRDRVWPAHTVVLCQGYRQGCIYVVLQHLQRHRSMHLRPA
jgi:hypothetical protein